MKRVLINIAMLTTIMFLTECDAMLINEKPIINRSSSIYENSTIIESMPENGYEETNTTDMERLDNNGQFTQLDNRNIIAPDGTEYVFLTLDPYVKFFGSIFFLGTIVDEEQTQSSSGRKVGMYSIEGDTELTILMRIESTSDYWVLYRKASLPELNLSLDNCIRFELIEPNETRVTESYSPDIRHMSCNIGMVNPDDIKAFLADVRDQQTSREAGLYDHVLKPDGFYENLSTPGIVYGYFKDAVNLAIPLQVMSFNDKGYSIMLNDRDANGRPVQVEKVLSEKWLFALQEASQH